MIESLDRPLDSTKIFGGIRKTRNNMTGVGKIACGRKVPSLMEGKAFMVLCNSLNVYTYRPQYVIQW